MFSDRFLDFPQVLMLCCAVSFATAAAIFNGKYKRRHEGKSSVFQIVCYVRRDNNPDTISVENDALVRSDDDD